MGGMALRAPVLAALFLIVTLATLAMPGSANFIGEFYILNGLFQAKIVFAFVAISGVAMSAYYALRLYQRTMHNRQARRASLSREIGSRDGARPGAARPLHPRPRPLPAADPEADRPDRRSRRWRSVTGGAAPEAKLAAKPDTSMGGVNGIGLDASDRELQRARTSTTPASRR